MTINDSDAVESDDARTLGLTAAELAFIAQVAGGPNAERVMEALAVPAAGADRDLFVETGLASLTLRGLLADPPARHSGDLDAVELFGALLRQSHLTVTFSAVMTDEATAYVLAAGDRGALVAHQRPRGIIQVGVVPSLERVRAVMRQAVSAALDAPGLEAVSIECADADGPASFVVRARDGSFDFGESAGLGSTRGAGGRLDAERAAYAFLDRVVRPAAGSS